MINKMINKRGISIRYIDSVLLCLNYECSTTVHQEYRLPMLTLI